MERDWGRLDPAWAGIRSEILRVAGTPVHALLAEGRRDGPTQLLVHGLGGAAVNWLEVIGGLAQRGPVLVPDLPGFGRTQPPRARAARIEHNLGFLQALLRTRGVTRAEVHGNSMGGMLATLLAAEEPRFVERLVLVDPALPGPTARLHELDPMTLRTFAPFVVPLVGERLLTRWYEESSAEELVAQNAAFISADASRVRPPVTAALVDNAAFGKRNPWRLESFSAAANSVVQLLLRRRRLDRAVAGIVQPTLLVWGDGDRLVGRPVIERVLARRPDFALAELPGVGHAPMLEAPQDYLDAVLGWLERDATAEVA